jgi:hypothetical protein
MIEAGFSIISLKKYLPGGADKYPVKQAILINCILAHLM